MICYTTNGIEVRGTEIQHLRKFLEEAVSKVKAGEMTQDEFVDAVESCFDEGLLLSLENAVVIRAVPERT